MEKNITIKWTIAAELIYSLALFFIAKPILDSENLEYGMYYIFEELFWVIYVVIFIIGATVSYWRGQTTWYWSIIYTMVCWFAFVKLIDVIYGTLIRFKHYPSIIKANVELNETVILSDLGWVTGLFTMLCVLMFCVIAPNIPNIIHKK